MTWAHATRACHTMPSAIAACESCAGIWRTPMQQIALDVHACTRSPTVCCIVAAPWRAWACVWLLRCRSCSANVDARHRRRQWHSGHCQAGCVHCVNHMGMAARGMQGGPAAAAWLNAWHTFQNLQPLCCVLMPASHSADLTAVCLTLCCARMYCKQSTSSLFAVACLYLYGMTLL